MTQNQEILYDSRFGNLTPEVAEKPKVQVGRTAESCLFQKTKDEEKTNKPVPYREN